MIWISDVNQLFFKCILFISVLSVWDTNIIVHQHNWASIPRVRPVNSSPSSTAYMRQWIGSTLLQIIACSAPSHYLNQWWHIVNWTLRNKPVKFHFMNMHMKIPFAKWWPFCPRGDELTFVVMAVTYVSTLWQYLIIAAVGSSQYTGLHRTTLAGTSLTLITGIK